MIVLQYNTKQILIHQQLHKRLKNAILVEYRQWIHDRNASDPDPDPDPDSTFAGKYGGGNYSEVEGLFNRMVLIPQVSGYLLYQYMHEFILDESMKV